MNVFQKMKVGSKLILAFSMMILVSIVIGIIGYVASARINQNVDQIFTVMMPGIDFLVEADRDLQQLLVSERSMVFAEKGTKLFDQLLADYEENLEQSNTRFEKYNALHLTDEESAIISKYESAREKWVKSSRSVVTALKSGTEVGRSEAISMTFGEAGDDFENMRGYINELTEINLKLAEAAHNDAGNTYAGSRNSIFVITVVGFLAGVFLIWWLTIGITRPLRNVITSITTGSDHVSSASAQVSEASQSLAEGASEMAAAIEETSSSLEEISSMIRQSAGNSKQADHLMAESKQIVIKANDFMSQLGRSMKEISSASEETSKIVKTIDEIAFQTNLLALNAAVEAARAGEAGAGFAVVADEVRSLAMRAAQAAKNTSELIDDTMKKVTSGTELSEATGKEFNRVTESATRVAELVGEIAAAAEEQAQGIGQISTAVDEMNTVTQKNAAGAEESASASEEMNAQAEIMKDMVTELMAMVGTGSEQFGHRQSGTKGVLESRRQHKIGGPGNKKIAIPARSAVAREVRKERLIPLEEKDFADF